MNEYSQDRRNAVCPSCSSIAVNTRETIGGYELYCCTACDLRFALDAFDADVDYDAAHNTAAERSNSAGGHANNTMTITNDTQAYIADGETWFLRIKVAEADNAAGALIMTIKDINVYYAEAIA